MIFTDGIWWLIIVFCLVFWIPQNVFHEGSHAIFIKLFKGKILEFFPFPSKRLDGMFSWAHIKYQYQKDMSETELGLISSGPLMMSFLMIIITSFLIFQFNLNPVVDSILISLYITNWFDASYNLSTFYRKPYSKPMTDGWRSAKHFNILTSHARIFTFGWQTIFGSLIFLPLWILK